MPEDNLSSLERVRRRLYSNQPVEEAEPQQLHEEKAEQSRGWNKLKAAQADKTAAPSDTAAIAKTNGRGAAKVSVN